MTALTQEQQLTRWVTKKGSGTRVLAVTSGKGGVGKTNVTVNLADRLHSKGYNVLVLDGDLGLGNVDVMVGLHPTYTLADVFQGRCTLPEIIQQGPDGVDIIPAGSGISELSHLGEEGQLELLTRISSLPDPPDYLILDTGAGIGANVRFLAGCAQEILVVVTPEPTSITDAYALMKVMAAQHGERRFRLLVNQARNGTEALDVFRRVSLAADRFLGVAVDLAGHIPKDNEVAVAIRAQRGITDPTGPGAGRAYTALADTVEAWRPGFQLTGRPQFFFNPMMAGGDSAAAAHAGG